jgi:hypothetical protein
MPYKKYIKKGGKIYGPYVYHSRRVDGKVVSEYRGPTKERDFKKFFLIIFGCTLLITLIYVLGFHGVQTSTTGNVVLDLDANYQETQPLEGVLTLTLSEGELIPSSSKIVFESSDQILEYDLRDFVLDSETEGDFFVSGSDISGTGVGYGLPGKKEIYPEVYFTLNILSEGSEEIPEETVEEVAEEPEESGLVEGISNFFLGVVMTGHVTLESEREIEGKVSVNEPFTYLLDEGERVEIKPRSVGTDSIVLSEDEISVSIEGKEVSVTTDYSELEEGFGVDYVGGREKEINLDISDLDLVFEPGELDVDLVYEEKEIISLTTMLGEGEIVEETPVVKDEEILVTKTEKTDLAEEVVRVSDSLSDSEREILIQEFGGLSVEATEAVLKNGFITVRYELGDYWIEYSYDEKLGEDLEAFMEQDRIQWLKDIAHKLSEDSKPEQEREDLLGNYSV